MQYVIMHLFSMSCMTHSSNDSVISTSVSQPCPFTAQPVIERSNKHNLYRSIPPGAGAKPNTIILHCVPGLLQIIPGSPYYSLVKKNVGLNPLYNTGKL